MALSLDCIGGLSATNRTSSCGRKNRRRLISVILERVCAASAPTALILC
jgi:hypothetical protein